MGQIQIIDNRLKNMMLKDKRENPNKIEKLLKSEIFYVFKNYMDINIDDVLLDIGIDNNGKYLINVSCEVNRLFVTNYLV